MPLANPYWVSELSIVPGERYDVELSIDFPESKEMFIKNEHNKGMALPIVYTYIEGAEKAKSPFQSP